MQDIYAIDRHDLDLACRSFRRFGFVRLRASPSNTVTAETLDAIERQLNLGDRYVSPAYASRPEYVETVGIATLQSTSSPIHTTFDGTAEQALHVDGTLEAIGHVRTLVLVCGGAAQNGGLTTLFNSAAAFTALSSSDPDAAEALTQECLTRDGTHHGQHRRTSGPAFAWDREGLLQARYSTTSDGSWNVSEGGAALRRGLDALRLMSEGGRNRCDFLLERGDAILIANDRIAHGRTAFEDSSRNRRILFRALYVGAPQGGPAAGVS